MLGSSIQQWGIQELGCWSWACVLTDTPMLSQMMPCTREQRSHRSVRQQNIQFFIFLHIYVTYKIDKKKTLNGDVITDKKQSLNLWVFLCIWLSSCHLQIYTETWMEISVLLCCRGSILKDFAMHLSPCENISMHLYKQFLNLNIWPY